MSNLQHMMNDPRNTPRSCGSNFVRDTIVALIASILIIAGICITLHIMIYGRELADLSKLTSATAWTPS